MKTYDIFFYEAYEEEAPAIRRAMGERRRLGFSSQTIQESGHTSPPSPLISIRTQSVVPNDWHTKLRGVLARTTGYDHLIPLRDAAGAGLALACLPEYCSRAVAEHAALAWLALLRRLPSQITQWSSFNRDGLTGLECRGRTLSIFGVGRIGHEVAIIGRGLGMNVIGVDIVRRHSDINYVEPNEGLREADVAVCAMNLTADNRGYFSHERLQQMKRGAIFVNVSRGECSSAVALLDVLKSGQLGGISLDVFEKEPALAEGLRSGTPVDDAEIRAVHELAGRPNVILTPHNAFNTAEALLRKSLETAQQAEHFLERGAFATPLGL